MDDDKNLDPIALEILDFLKDAPSNKPVSPEQIARAISEKAASGVRTAKPNPNAWRRYFQAVKDQAFFLARSERLLITRKGERVAPDDLKGLSGVWRMKAMDS